MLIQTVIGHENWPTGSTKLHLFVCPTTAYPMDNKEEHLWMVARSGSSGRRPAIAAVGSPRIMSAGQGLKPEIVGKWTSQVYEVCDNVLIKAMIMRSTTAGQQAANILLRTRDGAAIRRISVNTIPNAKSAMDRLILEGRFDLVDLTQAGAMGYRPPVMYMPTFQEARWRRLPYITITEIAPETVTASVVVRQHVQNMAGETVEVASTHKRRALDL